MEQWLGLTLYLPLVLLAVWFSWREVGPRIAGWILLAQWAVLNSSFFLLPVEFGPAILGMFSTVLMLALANHGSTRKWTGWHVMLIALCTGTLAVIFSYCYLMLANPTGDVRINWGRLHVLEVATNIIFAIKCLITGAWGYVSGSRNNLADRAGHRRADTNQVSFTKGDEA